MTTSTDLIAASSRLLEAGEYQLIRRRFPEWDTATTRLFEDKYNIVGVAVFTTVGELLESWADLQGELVEVISRHVGQSESKSWDGYLVLLTSAIAPTADPGIEAVRSDTSRLRKLVATGEDLVEPNDVERLLRPLLPLQIPQAAVGQSTALDLLPALLADQGITESTTRVLVQSYIEQEPLMEALHRAGEAR